MTKKKLSIGAGVLLLMIFSTVSLVDWADYREQEYYQQTMDALAGLEFRDETSDFWLAGWSKINATPDQPTTLVGYKPRGNYEFVLDSAYVRTLVVGNGKLNVAILNYELLIVHPSLAKRIEAAVIAADLPVDYIYFTATHTHSGNGGYIPGLMGKMAFGGFDEKVTAMLEQKTLQSIRTALSLQDTASIQFQKSDADSLVANRMVPGGDTDPYIRQLTFQKQNGEKAAFLSYSAHATVLSTGFMGLSGDYPHFLTQAMEAEEYDFALFAAGTVGSHRPVRSGNQPEDTKSYALALNDTRVKNISSTAAVKRNYIATARLPLALRDPHYRISKNIRLRPWVFNSLFGDTNAHFDIIQFGNTLLISSSGEISGVFYDSWENLARSKGLNLIITTFNGGYIGYITPDEYYNNKYHEVRSMNWFGPYNGAYFDEIIRELINKAR